jgi:hypothetical protein
MSKMDALRAMREARYEQMSARASKPVAAPKKAETPPPRPVEADPVSDSTVVEGAASLCGHRNMGGRTCTREHGHAAKSHRYS